MREKLSISVIFSAFPRPASGASIARGSPRIIGQKPEPTIRRGKRCSKGSLVQRELSPKVTEGLFCYKNLLFTIPPSCFASPLPLHKGGFGKFPPTEKHHQRKSLVVLFISPLRMQRREYVLFCSITKVRLLKTLRLRGRDRWESNLPNLQR